MPYYQPWLIIISDGKPNDNWHAAAAKTKQLSAQNKLVSLVVGVEGANLAILNEFSDRPAVKLQGLKFNEFFQWLSASIETLLAGDKRVRHCPSCGNNELQPKIIGLIKDRLD